MDNTTFTVCSANGAHRPFQVVAVPLDLSSWQPCVEAHAAMLQALDQNTSALSFTSWHVSIDGFRFLTWDGEDITPEVLPELESVQLRIIDRTSVVMFHMSDGNEFWFFIQTASIR